MMISHVKDMDGRVSEVPRGVGGLRGVAIVAACLAFSVPGTDLLAQGVQGRTPQVRSPIQSSVAEVPFGPGEVASYDVRLGRLPVGEGSMTVEGISHVRGRPSYHVSWRISGGIPLARVNDHFQTWFDVSTLATRRFIQDIHEVRYRNFRHFEIYPEDGRWERVDVEDGGNFTSEVPLDDISFIYYVRTLPLEVGETYTLEQYFREDRNPVILEVLRKETIEVPAGTFETVVVRPTIQAGGLFGEGGQAELYFSDDERRLIVRLSSRVPVIGSLTLQLKDYEAGQPLRSAD